MTTIKSAIVFFDDNRALQQFFEQMIEVVREKQNETA